MREILFRGKRLDSGEWVEGSFCPKNSKGDIPCIIVYNGAMAGYWFEVDPATVGQYTGLKDKNGQRIFEGDVIESDNGRARSFFVVRYGKFQPNLFYELLNICYGYIPKEDCFGVFGKSIKNGEEAILVKNKITTVLGNIHDNPALLEGGDRDEAD